ncbi:dTDP-4-dehydrorhamnose 3,5-epimerase [Mucilaginibacter antarcticus]|uniref:dTDP-4-dehydrorhamnose 3,5-epimerase n=1 Tax=Mucilaginibacter antarcticus TaxID=1855725 RepID=A0ABW5XN90_9SPHI
MVIIDTKFTDLLCIDFKSFTDIRGEFVKTIHKETFEQNKLDWNFTESFFSKSFKNVLRGMHFQYSPADHNKLVYVVSGKILDVVVDLRKESKTYGEFYSVELSDENRKGIYIGKGFAHGFLTLQDNSIVEYHTSTSQDRQAEGGIKWDSFGFEWPVDNPIMSERDSSFEAFNLDKTYF